MRMTRGCAVICELRDFLARDRAPYEVVDRLDRVTGPDSATGSRASRRPVKVVIVRDRGSFAVAVLPADAVFDLSAFRRRTGRYVATVADDDELKKEFPEFAGGPLPPFGRLFGIPVYLDRALAFESAMTFETGAPREVIDMPMSEYVRVERPAILPMTEALRAA